VGSFYKRKRKSNRPCLTNTPQGSIIKIGMGNCTIANGSDMQLAIANPIRYRGYYFDVDTGLYYWHWG